MSEEIAVLRAMAEDTALPPEIRQEAMVRLATLVPSVEDQIRDLVSVLPAEVVEMLADWPAPGE